MIEAGALLQQQLAVEPGTKRAAAVEDGDKYPCQVAHAVGRRSLCRIGEQGGAKALAGVLDVIGVTVADVEHLAVARRPAVTRG